MAERPRRFASPSPLRHFRAFSRPPAYKRRAIGESAPTCQLEARLRSPPGCYVNASSPTARR
eukprot:4729507-Alexandrium_andersonii.AAC.1